MAPLPLDVAYATVIKANRDNTNRFVLAQFAAGQHRDIDVAKFLGKVVPVVLASRKQVAALTSSFLSQKLSKQLGRQVRPRPLFDTDNLRGVDAGDIYMRPYKTVWRDLEKGKAYDLAVQAGARRLTSIVATDLQMAKTYSSRDVLSNTKGVTGFSRVVSGSTCALCLIASTQRYSQENLLPIHDRCDCGVEPITADNPWDADAAKTRLDETHAAVFDRLGVSDAGGRNVGLGTGRDYSKVIITQTHGEIGPVLAIRGQHFTGPAQVARAQTIPRSSLVDAQIKSYEEVLAAGGGSAWVRQQMPRLYAERQSLA